MSVYTPCEVLHNIVNNNNNYIVEIAYPSECLNILLFVENIAETAIFRQNE